MAEYDPDRPGLAMASLAQPKGASDERARLRAQVKALRDKWLATKEPWRAERIHAYNDVLALLGGDDE